MITERPKPWEVPPAVKLPEPVTCIACGRNEHELREAFVSWWGTSSFFGIGLCLPCSRDNEHDRIAEFKAAYAALLAVQRQPVPEETPA